MNRDIFLLILFSVHLIAFMILSIKTKDSKYFGPTISFILLVIAYGIKLTYNEIMIASLYLYEPIQWSAWIALGLSIAYRIFFYKKKAYQR